MAWIMNMSATWNFCIGEGSRYRAFQIWGLFPSQYVQALVPEAGRPREQVENHESACT